MTKGRLFWSEVIEVAFKLLYIWNRVFLNIREEMRGWYWNSVSGLALFSELTLSQNCFRCVSGVQLGSSPLLAKFGNPGWRWCWGWHPWTFLTPATKRSSLVLPLSLLLNTATDVKDIHFKKKKAQPHRKKKDKKKYLE